MLAFLCTLGPMMLIMHFAGKQEHPCSRNGKCLYAGSILFSLQLACISLSILIATKVKPRVRRKWSALLGIPLEILDAQQTEEDDYLHDDDDGDEHGGFVHTPMSTHPSLGSPV
jgi:hypothetical protein